MDERISFGPWLKQRRNALDLTQEALAQRVGCAKGTIRKLESDERRPSAQIASALAARLGVPDEERAAFVQFARGERALDRLTVSPPLSDMPPWRPAQRLFHTVRLPRDPLIGRDQERGAVCRMLTAKDVGLVTLTGTGGVGKTRLALQIAADLAGAFTDGIFCITLEAITDPALVPSTIARALDVSEKNGRPILTHLCDVLHKRELLLVLDNFEQVLPAAHAVATLLRTAPGLTVLATSRERLRLREEHVVDVPPLAVPGDAHLPARENLTGCPAVTLFVRRAQAVKADFRLSDANAAAVAQLCTRLDGLPLAIELAAARSTVLSPSMILARLGARQVVLTGGAQDLPARQQTLRATFDWTFELLTPAEQRLFAQLSVFAGGWTVAAAEAICASAVDDGRTPLDVLQALVEKSLVTSTPNSAGDARFSMLETVQEYAQEHLVAGDGTARLGARHADYYRTHAATAALHLQTDRQVTWLDQMAADLGNYRLALSWYRSTGQVAPALELAASLGSFWMLRGYVQEARQILEGLVQETPPALTTPARARVLHHLGQFTLLANEPEQAQRWLRESVDVARAVGDRAGLADTFLALARTSMFLDQLDAAAAWVEQSVTHYRAVEDRPGLTTVLLLVGDIAKERGDLERARQAYTTSLQFAEELVHPNLLGRATGSLGLLYGQTGDLGPARVLLERTVATFRAAGQPLNLGITLLNLAVVLADSGAPDEAQRSFDEGLKMLDALDGAPLTDEILRAYQGMIDYARGDYDLALSQYRRALTADLLARPAKSMLILVMERVAQVAVAQHDVVRAGLLLGNAETLRQTYKCALLPSEAAINAATVSRARQSATPEAFEDARRAGRRLTLQQAAAVAAGQTLEQSTMLPSTPDDPGRSAAP